tara:strand:- start:666 stop:1073 length:408 start_codon:yes stop_codon:yes gene_type:complete
METNILNKKIFIIFILSIISLFSFSQNPADYFKRGSKVYITSNKENVIKHASDKINLWGYWKVVPTQNQADFILNLDATFSLFYTINAQTITKDNKIIKRFNSKNSFRALDANPKRGAIKALFNKEIIPFVHGLF